MSNYWIVGATVQDENMRDEFISRGFWFGDRDSAQDVIDEVQKGDRFAMKRMLGQGATEVEINAIGIVQKANRFAAMPFKFFYVDWLDIRSENRRVPFSGLGGTIHRINREGDLAKQIFRL